MACVWNSYIVTKWNNIESLQPADAVLKMTGIFRLGRVHRKFKLSVVQGGVWDQILYDHPIPFCMPELWLLQYNFNLSSVNKATFLLRVLIFQWLIYHHISTLQYAFIAHFQNHIFWGFFFFHSSTHLKTSVLVLSICCYNKQFQNLRNLSLW